MKAIQFNLNDTIIVELEDEGFEHWMKWYNKTYEDFANITQNKALNEYMRPLEYFTSKKDKDGFVSFQAWNFMEIFGSSIQFGKRPIFNPNIKIVTND